MVGIYIDISIIHKKKRGVFAPTPPLHIAFLTI